MAGNTKIIIDGARLKARTYEQVVGSLRENKGAVTALHDERTKALGRMTRSRGGLPTSFHKSSEVRALSGRGTKTPMVRAYAIGFLERHAPIRPLEKRRAFLSTIQGRLRQVVCAIMDAVMGVALFCRQGRTSRSTTSRTTRCSRWSATRRQGILPVEGDHFPVAGRGGGVLRLCGAMVNT